jgi:hypothetical protein
MLKGAYMNCSKNLKYIAASFFLIAAGLAAQQKIQIAPPPKGSQTTQARVQTECKVSDALCPVITGISPDSQVVPGGTVRIFGKNLAYHNPQLGNLSMSFFFMGAPPGFGRHYEPDPWSGRPPGDPRDASPVVPQVQLRNVQWSDDSVVGTLPQDGWGAAIATDTYLQIVTDGGKSNKYPVKFSLVSSVVRRSSGAHFTGSTAGGKPIQPPNSPPRKQGGGGAGPSPTSTPATNATSIAAQQLQLENRIRVLQAQLTTAPAADKPRLQEQIRQVQQQILQLQGTRPGQIKQ